MKLAVDTKCEGLELLLGNEWEKNSAVYMRELIRLGKMQAKFADTGGVWNTLELPVC